MTKKILLSLGVIAVVGSVAAAAATGAFFSDTETSTGNTLTAGDIDLQVGNTAYYNGVLKTNSSWALGDITQGEFFFNPADFGDLKPGDWEEDTIELRVGSNDAWACMRWQTVENDENSLAEPETNLGDTEDVDPLVVTDGELASELNFMFWADDGDNVLEIGETPISLTTTTAAGLFNGAWITLADSAKNIFAGGAANTPLVANSQAPVFLGKAFCYGALTTSPVVQDGQITQGPDDPRGLNPADPGFDCGGEGTSNLTQTDKWVGSVEFMAEQARNNANFLCSPQN